MDENISAVMFSFSASLLFPTRGVSSISSNRAISSDEGTVEKESDQFARQPACTTL